MNEIEKKCRRLCINTEANPDAQASAGWQEYPEHVGLKPGQKVKVWHTWITTFMPKKKNRVGYFQRQERIAKKKLREIIERNEITAQKQHEFHTQKY